MFALQHKQEEADEMKRRFAEETRSDHIALLRAFEVLHAHNLPSTCACIFYMRLLHVHICVHSCLCLGLFMSVCSSNVCDFGHCMCRVSWYAIKDLTPVFIGWASGVLLLCMCICCLVCWVHV